MKNKRLTYFLIVVVLSVWGMIIYRIFQSVGGGDENRIVATPAKKEVYNDFEIQRDTTSLLLNYRDPFGLTKRKDSTSAKANTMSAVNKHTSKPVIAWDFIKYSGYIRNPGSKKLIALIKINGKNVMMSEGETAENVKLLKNMRDSIKVSYSGATKYIKIHSGT